MDFKLDLVLKYLTAPFIMEGIAGPRHTPSSVIDSCGIMAIDRGQMEAAKALGMTGGLAMRRIVLPQAARVIIPPLGNEFNTMIKNTSLASVTSVMELLRSGQRIISVTFRTMEILTGSGSP